MKEKTFQILRKNEYVLRKLFILNTVLKLIENEKLDKLSLNKIAKNIGISTATLNYYFPNLEELFFEACILNFYNIDTMMKKIIESALKEHSVCSLDYLADKIVHHLLNSEATFQMVSFMIAEQHIPEKLIEKFEQLKTELTETTLQLFKVSGFKNANVKTSWSFFSSIVGAILMFRTYPDKKMINPEEKTKDLVRYIVIMFKSGLENDN